MSVTTAGSLQHGKVQPVSLGLRQATGSQRRLVPARDKSPPGAGGESSKFIISKLNQLPRFEQARNWYLPHTSPSRTLRTTSCLVTPRVFRKCTVLPSNADALHVYVRTGRRRYVDCNLTEPKHFARHWQYQWTDCSVISTATSVA